MNDSRRYLTLRDYLRVLRQQRLLITIVTIVFAAAALAFSLSQPTVYEAEASVVFQEPAQALDLLGSPVAPTQTPEARAAEGAVAVTQPRVLRSVIKELELDTTVDALQGQVSAFAEADTNFVVIQAEASEAEQASTLANAVARQVQRSEAQEVRRRFKATAEVQQEAVGRGEGDDSAARALAEERISRLEALSEVAEPVDVVSFATVPEAPVSPKPVRNTLLGALLGLTFGILAAFIRDSLDRRLRGTREIEEHMGLPLVGSVSSDALGKTGSVDNGRSGISSLDAEAFRILRKNLELLDVDNPPTSVLVTSGLPQEGKSTVAASLARASAVAGKRTLLLECDLRRPSLAERLGLEAAPGLTDCLARGVRLEDVAQTVLAGDPPGLNGTAPQSGNGAEPGAPGLSFDCVTAGNSTPRPAELLGSQSFSDFLRHASERYDMILLDSSPLLPVADTLEMIAHADAVLVCVRSRSTTQDEARAARAALENAPLKPSALVVTGVRPGDDATYGHYSYSYAYGHQRVH